MADILNVHEAKTHLSRLLEKVRRGATVTIAKAGQPIAQLVPIGKRPADRGGSSGTRPSEQSIESRSARLQRFLEQEAWPAVPANQIGRRLTRDEEDALLGYGDRGV